MKPRINLFITIGALLLLAALSFPGRTVEAQVLPPTTRASLRGLCPPVQNTPFFTIAYGAVTLDGTSAPVGTVVEARSPRGDVVGCFEVTTAGNYGMMYIYGEDTTVTPPIPGMRAGETVTFYVNGSPAIASPTLIWSNDKTWHQVNLAAVGTPTADFSGTPRQGVPSLSVSFTNLSTGNYNTCAWAFGDGGTSTSCTNPSNTYTTPGSYTVSLTVSGDLGSDTETKTGYITVYTPVNAQFSGTPTSGIAPSTVTFSNTSTGDYTACAWNFGDSGTSSACTPPAHVYSNSGVYAVSLTVSGPGGSDTETKTGYITVYAPVDAKFSAAPTAGPASLAVAFTNSSTGDYSTCAWTFGDGGTSSACSPPTHTYNTPGVYTVALTVSGSGGSDTETKTGYITVYAPVSAQFSATPTVGIAPLPVAFTNASTGDYTTCEWNFGDGSTSGVCDPPAYTYNTPGIYTVSLTVSGPGGSDTETKTGYITVYTPVNAQFSGTPTAGIAPLIVTFTNTSTGDYSTCAWTFGDGSTSSACTPPAHTYNNPGVYDVSLTVSGLGGTDTETKMGYITVYTPVDAQFSGSPAAGVAPLTVTFANASTGDYDTCAWTFGDGSTSNLCMPSLHPYSVPGTYTVTLTVSGLGGTDTESKDSYITVYEPPVAEFGGTPTAGPNPLMVVFTNLSTGDFDTCAWSFGDGDTANTCAGPSHSYADAGVYTVTLTVLGLGGTDVESKLAYITVYEQAVAEFSAAPTGGPLPLEVSFTNLSGGVFDSCVWNFGDGATSATCSDQAHTYAQAGVYTVTLTVSGLGGSDTEVKPNYITVYTPPTAEFGGAPVEGAAPHAVQFTNLSTGDYDACAWQFGDGASSGSCADPLHTYMTPGIYTVTLTVSGNGGTDVEIKPQYITVHQAVNAGFSAQPTAGPAELVVAFTNLSTGDYDTCSWSFGDGVTSDNCNDPAHTYATPGVYTVSLLVSGPGGSDTEIKPNYITVYTPVTAGFSATPTAGPASLTVTFTNESIGDFTTCAWTFGDGNTSNACNPPAHAFTTPGVYTVSLAVSGPGGSDTETKTGYITVYMPVNAQFSGDPTVGVGTLAVTFTNISTGDYDTCAWNFGDGGTSNVCNPSAYTYTIPGVYTVSLTVSGPGGTDTETKTSYIRVYARANADFSGAPLSGGAPLDVTFTNLSTGDFSACSWVFGDGGTSNSCNPPVHRYESPGTYTVILAVTGLGGSDTETKLNYITVYGPPVANFTATPTAGPASLLVEFTNQSTGVYNTCLWAFGDGGSSTDCSPDHTYSAPGIYTVLLMVSGPGGSDSLSRSNYIAVYVPVAAEFSATPTTGVAPLLVTFANDSTGDYTTCAWDFGDGGTSNACTTPVHTYTTGGAYTVTLTVSGPGGTDTETKAEYVTVYTSVDAGFVITPTHGIAPLLVTFDNLSTGDFETCSWAFGDDTSSDVCAPSTHTYDTPGVYTVTLTVIGAGGIDTESKTVTAYERVDAQFDATPKAGVAPLAVIFSDLSIGDYTTCAWDFGDSSTSTDCSPPSHTYSAPGVYTVTLSVSGPGGADTEAKTNYITVYARLHADFSATPTKGVAPLEVTFNNLSVGDYTSCTWVFGDGITSIVQHPVHTYNLSGVYTVSLTVRGIAGEDTKTSVNFISVMRDYLVFLPVVIRGN